MATILKLNQALMDRLGATNGAEASAAIEALIESSDDAPPATSPHITERLDRIDAVLSEHTDTLQTLSERQTPKTEVDRIVTLAKTEASHIAASALAGSGLNPAAPSAPVANPAESQEPEPSDYDGRWALLKPQAKSEFLHDPKLFAAYERARLAGQIKMKG